MSALRWETSETGTLEAYSGDLRIGFVLRRSVDGVIVYKATDAVFMRHITKGNGEVSSFASGKRAVERAWQKWLDAAALS